MEDDYITPKEVARRAGVTQTWIRTLCAQGRIKGAKKWGRSWMIPAGAEVETRQPRITKIPRAKEKRKTR
jgi:excisionase family DNA binding protein